MTAATETRVYHVVLSDESVLAFDHGGEFYRLVRYKRIKPSEGLEHISAAKFDDLVRRGILPRGYHTNWTRYVVADKRLLDGLRLLFKAGRSSLDAAEVERYIRQMSWGNELP